MVDTNFYKIKLKEPNLKDKLFFAADGNLLLQLPATESEIAEFNSVKKRMSSKQKYYCFLHDMYHNAAGPMYEKEFYSYYIPEDIYDYLEWVDGTMKVKNTVPVELKEKAINCARWIDIEFNYALLNLNAVILNGKKLRIKNINKFPKTIIVIKKSKEDRISITLNYKQVEEGRFIQGYNRRDEIKKWQLDSNHAID